MTDRLHLYATDIDSYAYYLASDIPTERYVAELRGEVEPDLDARIRMQFGTAVHAFLEDSPGSLGEQDLRRSAGYRFLRTQAAVSELVALDAERAGGPGDPQILLDLKHPDDVPQVTEFRCRLAMDIGGTEVTLRGKIDALAGNTIVDYKVTARPDAGRYMESWQWRIYMLAVPTARRFVYRLFQARIAEARRRYRATEVTPLTLYRYPAMLDDVRSQVRDMVGFCRSIGWSGRPIKDDGGSYSQA